MGASLFPIIRFACLIILLLDDHGDDDAVAVAAFVTVAEAFLYGILINILSSP